MSHAHGHARYGAVAAGNADGVAAGMELLADGGNAFDALVATAFAMGVVEPLDCGLGGGGFASLHAAAASRSDCLDFMSTAPAAARYELYHSDTPDLGYQIAVRERANEQGHRSVAVPGAVAGLAAINERFGKATLARCLEPAIRLARHGFAMAKKPVTRLQRTLERVRAFEPTRTLFLTAQGQVPELGAWRRNPDYAQALEQIARAGPAVFYEGDLARAMVQDMTDNGGFVDARDLAAYRIVWREPARGEFAGHRVLTVPPPSSGRLVLTGLDALAAGTGESRHGALARAMLHMFAARSRGLGDPAFSVASAESLETTSMSAIDIHGNAASLTYSLNIHSGVVVPGTGMLLNNQMLLLHPWDNTPNSVAPGKRPASSMMPTLVFDDDGVRLAFGASGSSRIPSALMQVLVRFLLGGASLHQAIDGPRLHAEAPRMLADEELASIARPLAAELGLALTLIAGRESSMGAVQGVARRGTIMDAVGDPRSGAAGKVR